MVKARTTRRRFLLGAGAIGAYGVGSALLAACTPASAPAATTAASAAPAAAASPTPRKGGTLVEGGTVDPQGFNGMLATTGTTQVVSAGVFEPLLDIDEKSNLVPALAESVPAPSDAKTYVFKLRKDLKWSDGKPITSDDVVFTFKTIFDPAYKDFSSFIRGQAERTIASVDATDANTVTIVTKDPNAAFLSNFGILRVLPKHILGSLSAKELNTTDFNSAPTVASGPFKFAKWDKGQEVRLVRNESYWRGPTNVDTYVRKVLGTDDKIATAVKLGEVDMAKIPPSQLSVVQNDPQIDLIRFQSRAFWFYATQTGNKILADKTVRQALRYAVDVDRIKKAAFLDNATVSLTHIPPWNWASDKDPKTKYALDVSKAKALLDQAGWKVGASGTREKDGTPFKISISAASETNEAKLIAQILQEQWKAVGVEAEIKLQASNQLVADVVQKHAFDVWVASVSTNQDPDFITQLYHSANAKPGGVNTTDYKNPTVDKLFDDARAITDQARRTDMYKQIQNILLDDLPVAPLVIPEDTVAVRKRVVGVKYTLFADNGNRTWIKDVWVTDGR
jgi:peptide/nickel transport system substrate-binding protein